MKIENYPPQYATWTHQSRDEKGGGGENMKFTTNKYADVLIPRGVDNLVATHLIVQHIQDLRNGGLCKRQSNSCLNGYTPPRLQQHSEASSRPH
ncbi:uridine-cytidine kinase 2-like [Lacerta agilis]|uniref:uridine-cytidine kinase 2-like n=1 Tax=Lacerta agilis TaxID=80427 RepID=UPI0014199FF7|nr:uridine-cytidine kinase 2-like [Lacerta agilis]